MTEAMAPNRIRQLRDDLGWTVRDLAEKSGIDFSTINRMERGAQALDLPRMQRIARAIGVRASALLADEDVELRASEHGQAVLAELNAIDPAEIPDVIAAAREVVRLARNMAAQRSSGALLGRSQTVAALADVWNGWDDSERERGLELLRLAGRMER